MKPGFIRVQSGGHCKNSPRPGRPCADRQCKKCWKDQKVPKRRQMTINGSWFRRIQAIAEGSGFTPEQLIREWVMLTERGAFLHYLTMENKSR